MSIDTSNDQKLEHYVTDVPFNPRSIEALSPEQERYYLASQWQLMWWKLKRHRLAVVSGGFLLLTYFSILISEIIAPYNLHERHTDYLYAPPQSVHLMHEGEFQGPFVYGMKRSLNMELLQWVYTEDTSKIHKIRFFCLGDDYNLSLIHI